MKKINYSLILSAVLLLGGEMAMAYIENNDNGLTITLHQIPVKKNLKKKKKKALQTKADPLKRPNTGLAFIQN